MIEKEISELRRHLKRERCGITRIHGCYVDDRRQIVSTFDQSLAALPEDEQEKYLTLLKKALSGTLGKNLVDISFSTEQVADSDEHRLLMALRADPAPEALQKFYETVVTSLELGVNYLILVAGDTYDVPYRSKDGALQEDAGDSQHAYFLCVICPVKMSKPALCYDAGQREFHNRAIDWVVGMPELGFVFPAFDDRRTNLYGALYYCRDAAADYDELIEAVFHTPAPMPATTQRDTFRQVLSQSLGEECRYEVVQTVHEQLAGMIAAHKEAKEEQPLTISRGQVDSVLKDCGVSEPRVAAFHVKFDEAFGTDSELRPGNLIDSKQFELRTPSVVIRVDPERQELVQTRDIGGVPYILVRADAGVELNGVDLQLGTRPE